MRPQPSQAVLVLIACIVTPRTLGGPAPATQPAAPALTVRVDPRVELLSLVFRLAGNPEYTRGRVKLYTDEVERRFSIFRAHPAVTAAKELRRRRGISYDAVMSMAVHITDTVQIKELVPFLPLPPDLDSRWTTADARDFLVKLRALVKDSDFNGFVKAHEPLYVQTAERFRELLAKKAHLEWFNEFFGARPAADFVAAPGLLNGGSCYGASCHVAGREQLYCILGVWLTDVDGRPQFDETVLPTVIHEFTHSYANALIDARLDELRPAGEALFPRVSARMQRMAYGNWQTMMRESLVRACVIRYQRRYDGALAAAAATTGEVANGFLWMPTLVSALGEYEERRSKSGTNLKEFMPRFVTIMSGFAKQLDGLQEEARSPP